MELALVFPHPRPPFVIYTSHKIMIERVRPPFWLPFPPPYVVLLRRGTTQSKFATFGENHPFNRRCSALSVNWLVSIFPNFLRVACLFFFAPTTTTPTTLSLTLPLLSGERGREREIEAQSAPRFDWSAGLWRTPPFLFSSPVNK